MDSEEYYELKQQLAEANQKLQEVEAARLVEKKRAERYEATITTTSLDRHLELVESDLIPTLTVERAPSKRTSETLRLRENGIDGSFAVGDDFEDKRDRIYNLLVQPKTSKLKQT